MSHLKSFRQFISEGKVADLLKARASHWRDEKRSGNLFANPIIRTAVRAAQVAHVGVMAGATAIPFLPNHPTVGMGVAAATAAGMGYLSSLPWKDHRGDIMRRYRHLRSRAKK